MAEHPEGRLLKALIEPRARPVDIARAAGCSPQFVCNVLAGRRRATPRIIAACRDLGLPVDAIYGDSDGPA